LLSLRDLTVAHGGVVAVNSVSLDVTAGEIVALVGANGAGKSSLLRAVAGLIPSTAGSISFKGEDLAATDTVARVRLGMSLVPEDRALFPEMTCGENLRLGLYARRSWDLFDKRAETVFLLFPRLRERLGQKAGTLSGGEQQMLAIGRALMQEPELLLLDEPSLGLSPGLTRAVFEKIAEIRRSGVTILLVEQKARLAMDLADRAYVLSVGKVVREGRAADLKSDETLGRLYFGVDSRPAATGGESAV
jgi:branched-chain amino acid transport system ATP-binding protein